MLLESNLLILTGTEAQVEAAQALVTKLLRAELEPELQSGEALAHVDVTGVVAQIIGASSRAARETLPLPAPPRALRPVSTSSPGSSSVSSQAKAARTFSVSRPSRAPR